MAHGRLRLLPLILMTGRSDGEICARSKRLRREETRRILQQVRRLLFPVRVASGDIKLLRRQADANEAEDDQDVGSDPRRGPDRVAPHAFGRADQSSKKISPSSYSNAALWTPNESSNAARVPSILQYCIEVCHLAVPSHRFAADSTSPISQRKSRGCAGRLTYP